jgi:hypothetical protein
MRKMEGSGETITSSTGGVTTPMSDTGALDTGFDSGFEEVTTQMPVAASDATSEDITLGDQSFDNFVHSEKSAHDKLLDLSQMGDTPEADKAEVNPKTDEIKEKLDSKEPTIEQKVMLLQAEALKLLARGSREKNEKDMAELLKKLKELIESIGKNGESVSSSVLGVVLGMFMVMGKAGEAGTSYLDEEVKRNQVKN